MSVNGNSPWLPNRLWWPPQDQSWMPNQDVGPVNTTGFQAAPGAPPHAFGVVSPSFYSNGPPGFPFQRQAPPQMPSGAPQMPQGRASLPDMPDIPQLPPKSTSVTLGMPPAPRSRKIKKGSPAQTLGWLIAALAAPQAVGSYLQGRETGLQNADERDMRNYQMTVQQQQWQQQQQQESDKAQQDAIWKRFTGGMDQRKQVATEQHQADLIDARSTDASIHARVTMMGKTLDQQVQLYKQAMDLYGDSPETRAMAQVIAQNQGIATSPAGGAMAPLPTGPLPTRPGSKTDTNIRRGNTAQGQVKIAQDRLAEAKRHNNKTEIKQARRDLTTAQHYVRADRNAAAGVAINQGNAPYTNLGKVLPYMQPGATPFAVPNPFSGGGGGHLPPWATGSGNGPGTPMPGGGTEPLNPNFPPSGGALPPITVGPKASTSGKSPIMEGAPATLVPELLQRGISPNVPGKRAVQHYQWMLSKKMYYFTTKDDPDNGITNGQLVRSSYPALNRWEDQSTAALNAQYDNPKATTAPTRIKPANPQGTRKGDVYGKSGTKVPARRKGKYSHTGNFAVDTTR